MCIGMSICKKKEASEQTFVMANSVMSRSKMLDEQTARSAEYKSGGRLAFASGLRDVHLPEKRKNVCLI